MLAVLRSPCWKSSIYMYRWVNTYMYRYLPIHISIWIGMWIRLLPNLFYIIHSSKEHTFYVGWYCYVYASRITNSVSRIRNLRYSCHEARCTKLRVNILLKPTVLRSVLQFFLLIYLRYLCLWGISVASNGKRLFTPSRIYYGHKKMVFQI